MRYSQDPQFALVLRMLPALAFAPVGDVIDYFEALEEIFPEEAEEVVSYFEKNYVRGLRPNGQRRTPRFPIALWNVNERTLSGQEIIIPLAPSCCRRICVASINLPVGSEDSLNS